MLFADGGDVSYAFVEGAALFEGSVDYGHFVFFVLDFWIIFFVEIVSIIFKNKAQVIQK